MNEADKDTIILEKKARLFLEKNTLIHCRLKNGTFYNGQITYVGSDFIMVKDRKIGETPIFYLEIKIIEPFDSNIGSFMR